MKSFLQPTAPKVWLTVVLAIAIWFLASLLEAYWGLSCTVMSPARDPGTVVTSQNVSNFCELYALVVERLPLAFDGLLLLIAYICACAGVSHLWDKHHDPELRSRFPR